MISKEEQLERIVKASKPLKEDMDFNCIGTALYITGVTVRDSYINCNIKKYLEKLDKADKPEVGYLLLLRDPENLVMLGYGQGNATVYHMALITETDPLKITHRIKIGAHIEENQIFEEFINSDSFYKHFKPKYIIPQHLDLDILDNEWLWILDEAVP